jgi:hypothetical protein
MCGGPRIPGGAGGDDADNALRQTMVLLGAATRAKARSLAWSILALFATLVVVVASAKVVLLALAIVPALLAIRAHAQANKRKESAEEVFERAWLAAAEQIARRSSGGVTAEELASSLSIDTARADALLTQLAVHDKTRIDVGDDAEVRYSVSPDVLAAELPADEPADADEEEAIAFERRRHRRDEG